ncbi:aldehyde dehydrogenase family protein [Algoriphagus hitonicola]|uniref:Aldehyde dehydrogenase n=1 Tax=Algoriphagus hitonicola TaxID=435880 RepID=A0A1I2S7N5_9BACT|nr:aldehyde dehydrogenase family protein [Algoriphagus hitonicola]SFG45991.1 aldehyde dehydrogenase (NAD+) [Algoriphagus hitonicola]
MDIFESRINSSDFSQIFDYQYQTALAWRNSSLEERKNRIVKIRDWVKTNQDAIRKALTDDFNKPSIETDLSEIFPVTSEINHALKNLKAWMKSKKIKTPLSMTGTSAWIQYEPKGRALIIAPWNYPFSLAIGPLISALAAGCPVMLKPSEMTPATSLLIEEMINTCFDSEEVSVILGDAKVAEGLLALPFDHVFFTGSPQIGKLVMKQAAKHLSSVTLELGGKSPAIITSSADIQDAAQKIIWGKLINCGQTCVAPDYILIHQSQHKLLLSELRLAIQQYYDPQYKGIEQSPDYGRIINDRHFQRLAGYLDDAIEKGAQLEFGGTVNQHHRYIEPTLLSNINESMSISQEEIFGPLLPILTFDDIQEAIDYVNGKPKPLSLYIFDQEKSEREKILLSCSSGNAVINDCVLQFLHHEFPFGGVNNSGIGKSHGYHGFLAFSNEKGVLKQRVGLNNVTLLRPPYGIKTKQIINSLIKWF